MQRFFRLSLITIISIQALSGCAYLKGKKAIIKSQDMAYMETRETAALQVPNDLQAAPLGDDLLVPVSATPWAGKPPSLLPPESLADRIASGKVNSAVLKQSVKLTAKSNTSQILAVKPAAALSTTGLTLAQNFAHAWSSIGLAIPAAGYKTLNENKAIGRYFIADLPSTNGKLVRDTEIYQLQITTNNKLSVITITDNLEKPVASVIAKRILGDIQQGLQTKPKSWWSR